MGFENLLIKKFNIYFIKMIDNTNKDDYKVDEENKIYIVGGRGVGKTSFFNLIFSVKYQDKIQSSELGISKSQYKIGNKQFTIKELTDDEKFTKTNVLKDELEDILLIFVIFAKNDKNSFEYAKTLIEFIKNNLINNKDLNIILIGNKCDIGEDEPNSIEVHNKEVDQYIFSLENIYYYEFSCKSEKNLENIKQKIEEIEIEEEKDEDDDKIPEEERKKKVNEAKEKSCIIS